MQTINVEVRWTEKNFCCGWGNPEIGTVMCTNKTLDGLKIEFAETLKWHIDSMVADGEDVPEWLVNEQYNVVYDLHTSALLREAEKFTTMTALSKETGINVKQLSHYASATKNPRPAQRQRIIEGLHSIGRKFLTLC